MLPGKLFYAFEHDVFPCTIVKLKESHRHKLGGFLAAYGDLAYGRGAAANGVAGGRQTIYVLALNWYVNRNVRFMFDYLHGDVAKQVSVTNVGNIGAKFDAFAMRTQIAF